MKDQLGEKERKAIFRKLFRAVVRRFTVETTVILLTIPTKEDLEYITTVPTLSYKTKQLTIFELANARFMDALRKKQDYSRRYDDGKYTAKEQAADPSLQELKQKVEDADRIVIMIANAAGGKFPRPARK